MCKLCLGIFHGQHRALITPLYNSDSHSTHLNVVKEQPSRLLTTWFCRMQFSSAGVHPLLGSAVSGNPSSSCMLLAIHSVSLVGSHLRTGYACCRHTRATPASGVAVTCASLLEMHCHSWQLELPTPSMASAGLDQASLSSSGCDWCYAQETIN